jgi:hypothetical protein
MLLCLWACAPEQAADTPAVQALAQTPARAAELILEESARAQQAIQPFDEARRGEPEYFEQYRELNREAWNWSCELGLELYRSHPEHAHVLLMMRERWRLQCTELGQLEDALREMDAVASDPASPPALADEARYSRALALLGQLQVEPEVPKPALLTKARSAVDAMLLCEPKDPRCEELLWQLGLLYHKDPLLERECFARLLELYPTGARSSLYQGKLRQLDGVGQLFELPVFEDAIDGRSVDIAALRGQVLVIVFWSARAEPALERLAEWQELSRNYADRGVAFLGVSLDEREAKGGRELLLKTVAEHGLDWPQNYLGAGWLSPFSVSWGITRLPQVFVVDDAGVLVSTSAQGALEAAIQAALQKRPDPELKR